MCKARAQNLENRFCFHWAESKASQLLDEGQCPHTSGHADPGHEPDKHWLGRHGSARGMGKRPWPEGHEVANPQPILERSFLVPAYHSHFLGSQYSCMRKAPEVLSSRASFSVRCLGISMPYSMITWFYDHVVLSTFRGGGVCTQDIHAKACLLFIAGGVRTDRQGQMPHWALHREG